MALNQERRPATGAAEDPRYGVTRVTKAQSAREEKAAALRNPLTGQAPNSFTQATNRTLPEPRNAKEQPRAMPDADRRRQRAQHREATEPRASNQFQPSAGPPVGYQKPADIDNHTWAWMMGAHHMFPNMAAEQGNPAINEPHAADPGVTVQRRAEDLSGKEYRKGLNTMANYGHDPRDPMRSLIDVTRQTLHRTMAEHVAAGVEESASQHFYGGAPVQTHIPDERMQEEHEVGVSEGHARFMMGVQRVVAHPDFQAATQGMSHREQLGAATNLMAQATADTSPQNRWRQGEGWPNVEQAEESARAGVSRTTPQHRSGFPANTYKATARVDEMTHGAQGFADDERTGTGERFAPHVYGDHVNAAKTVAFRGALASPTSPDSFKVSDVHEGSSIIPGANTSKATHWLDSEGNRVVRYPDQPESRVRGMQPEIDEKTGKQKRGSSRAEDMLKEGKSTVHALNDYATRQVLAEHGLSRGGNYADNVHQVQAATWGSQQVRRVDPQMADVSHASQYPVIRDWAAEGDASGIRPEWQHLFRGVSGNLGPQFRANPNTSGIRNPTRQPYPHIPE